MLLLLEMERIVRKPLTKSCTHYANVGTAPFNSQIKKMYFDINEVQCGLFVLLFAVFFK